MSEAADITAELEDALEDMEGMFGDVEFTYEATGYVCTPGQEEHRKEMEEAGYVAEYDVLLVARQSVFTPGKAAIRKQVDYNGTAYRVTAVIDHGFGHSWVLMLKAEK